MIIQDISKESNGFRFSKHWKIFCESLNNLIRFKIIFISYKGFQCITSDQGWFLVLASVRFDYKTNMIVLSFICYLFFLKLFLENCSKWLKRRRIIHPIGIISKVRSSGKIRLVFSWSHYTFQCIISFFSSLNIRNVYVPLLNTNISDFLLLILLHTDKAAFSRGTFCSFFTCIATSFFA